MCDEGRYGYHHVHDADRADATRAARRRRLRTNVEWSQLPRELDQRAAQGRPPGRRALAASDGRRSVPAGASIVRGIDPRGRAGASGRCRSSARTRRSRTASRSAPRSARTAAASRQIVAHFMRRRARRSTISSAASKRRTFGGVWVTGGYKTRLDRRRDGRAVRRRRRCWSCRTCSPRRCGSGPTYQLPGAAFAEREGSYVNHADRLQSFALGHPPAGRRAGRRPACIGSCWACPGLYKPRRVLDEIGREIAVLLRRRRRRARRGRRFESQPAGRSRNDLTVRRFTIVDESWTPLMPPS